jgi:hypothetical protein
LTTSTTTTPVSQVAFVTSSASVPVRVATTKPPSPVVGVGVEITLPW